VRPCQTQLLEKRLMFRKELLKNKRHKRRDVLRR